MAFASSKVEFENRFWVIGAVFFVGFGLYAVDGETALNPLARWLVGLGVPEAAAFHGVVAAMAALVVAAAMVRSWATAYLRASVVHDASDWPGTRRRACCSSKARPTADTWPRFPAVRARVPAGDVRPDWWSFAGGMMLFAITLSPTPVYASLAVGFGVYFVQAWWRGRG
jgi:hypothetical protein